MYNLIEATKAAAPVPTATGYVIFIASVLVLVGILRYFTQSNKV